MRVLVVEDYAPVRAAVREGLAENGFAVDTASDGEEGLWLAESNPYDVIVLDLMLPKMDGNSVLRKLRAKGSQVAVIVLTARDQLDDRVRGLVRRRYDMRDPTIRVADVEIDTARREVRRAGEAVTLSAREYALLEYLAMRVGQVVTRTEIWEHVYDFHSEAHSNVV